MSKALLKWCNVERFVWLINYIKMINRRLDSIIKCSEDFSTSATKIKLKILFLSYFKLLSRKINFYFVSVDFIHFHFLILINRVLDWDLKCPHYTKLCRIYLLFMYNPCLFDNVPGCK